MTKTKCFSGASHLSALGIAGFLVAVCSIGTVLAETNGAPKLEDRAKDVSNNFGELLKGMGQELQKVIGSEDKSAGNAAVKDGNKEAKHADDKVDKNEKSK